MTVLRPGFVALFSMLILAAVGVVIASGLLLAATREGNVAINTETAALARVTATSCVERALMTLRDSLNYAGNEVLTFGGYTCQIGPITGNGNKDRTIQATSTISGVTWKIFVDIETVKRPTKIRRWEDVISF